ncbi:MAG: hypothetical protein R2867_16370 [Caldilineaceae bacterium]
MVRTTGKALDQQFKGQALRLIIDCTKVGSTALSISIAYKRPAVGLEYPPWRKGHVGYNAQLELLQYLVRTHRRRAEVWLLGDAGFESVHLFSWLTRTTGLFLRLLRVKTKSGQATVGQLSAIPVQPGETRNIGWVELTAKLPPDLLVDHSLESHWRRGALVSPRLHR